MTYKKIKFEDSAVMRSLEKLAVKNGLIKPDAMKKEAAAKVEGYAPTENLGQNILKLCSGLRARGLGKYAAEVENKFIALKTAESIEYSNMLNDAHSEGSHKMKDMEGDATIETLEDRQKKIQEIVDKTPKGKFAARDAINLVKITLGQAALGPAAVTEESLTAELNSLMENFVVESHKLQKEVEKEVTFSSDQGWSNIYFWAKNPTIDHLENIKEHLIRLKRRYAPHLGGATGVTKETWSVVGDSFDKLESTIDRALTSRSRLNKLRKGKFEMNQDAPASSVAVPGVTPAAPAAKVVSPVAIKVKANIDVIKRYMAQVSADLEMSPKDKNDASNWLKDTGEKFEAQLSAFNLIPDPEKEAGAVNTLKNISVLEGRLAKFYNNWLA